MSRFGVLARRATTLLPLAFVLASLALLALAVLTASAASIDPFRWPYQ